jgi:hypothetical protein
LPAEPLPTRSVQRTDRLNNAEPYYAQPQALCPVCLQWTDVSPDQLISWEKFVCAKEDCGAKRWVDGEDMQYKATKYRREQAA